MRQTEGINQARKGKHLNWEERIQIETLHREGFTEEYIGERLGRSVRTIKRELKRGWVTHRTGRYSAEERYSADRGRTSREAAMRSRTTTKTPDARLLALLFDHLVGKRSSPGVVAAFMKAEELEYAVCEKTIYNMVDAGKVPGVTNASLWEKRERNKPRKSLRRKRKRAVDPGHGIIDRQKVSVHASMHLCSGVSGIF